jgi:hypothetical protein
VLIVVTPWSRDCSGENLGRSSEEIELDMTMLVVKKTPVLLCVTLEMESEYESNENSAKVR